VGLQAERVALGFRVKTGRAIAVALAGPLKAPRVLARRELVLHDASAPESCQPYHAGLELPLAQAEPIVQRLVEIARAACDSAVRALLAELAAADTRPRAGALVVASLTDPATIRNAHMHAHAAEGRLFHEALVAALERCDLPCSVHAEKDLFRDAARTLRTTEGALERTVLAIGKAFGNPWRADEKAAALVAWIALAEP